ncbi:MAG: energy-coupling factor transporter transmembrane protein EcfT [Clostridiales bacterium]|nr:energy-coupling factor transporter transmembrane protein EcfT [Clostridiales bacterium]
MKVLQAAHPAVLLVYFLAVTLVAMFVWNPAIQLLALAGGAGYAFLIRKRGELKGDLAFYLLLFLLIAVTNPLFSHNGVTPLFFLNGNPVTKEAIVYGVAIAGMMLSVLLWCRCYSRIMTSDKFLFLFGKAIPRLSLVLSMALRFIPLFRRQMKRVGRAQKTMGLYASGGYVDRVRGGLRVFSALITWSLENAMDTAASMKARGYGLKGRSHFALFRFDRRDALLLLVSGLLLLLTLCGVGAGLTDFSFYPTIGELRRSPAAYLTYGTYGALSFLPFILEIEENLKWTYYRSKA